MTPYSPFQKLQIPDDSTTLDVDGSFIVIPTGSRDALRGFNEFTLISHRDPFYLVTEYDPGSLAIQTVNAVVEAPDGSNSGTLIPVDSLESLGYSSVDDVNYTVTTEFTVRNLLTGTNSFMLDACDSVDGWTGTDGAISSITIETVNENSRVKVTGITDSNGALSITKPVSWDLSAYPIFRISLEPSGDINILVALKTSATEYMKWENVSRLSITANSNIFLMLPADCPAGSVGVYPTVRTSGYDKSNITEICAGIYGTPNTEYTYYIDNLKADYIRPVYVELRVPDVLAASSLTLYTHNGTEYLECGTYGLNGMYNLVSETPGNFFYVDGTRLSDVYGTSAHHDVFPKGMPGSTTIGGMGSITYGTSIQTGYRIGIMVYLPPGNGLGTPFDRVQFKTVVSYINFANLVPEKSLSAMTISGAGCYLQDTFGAFSSKTLTDKNLVEYGTLEECSTGLNLYTSDCAQVLTGDTTPYIFSPSTLLFKFNVVNVSSDIQEYTINVRVPDAVESIKLFSLDSFSEVNTVFTKVSQSSGVENSYSFSGRIHYKTTRSYVLAVKYTSLIYTYNFSNDVDPNTGLRNMSEPFILIGNDTTKTLDYFLFTSQPTSLKLKQNSDGILFSITLYPSGGIISHGQMTYADFARDTNADFIPDYLDPSIVGSLANLLDGFSMVRTPRTDLAFQSYVTPAISDIHILPDTDLSEHRSSIITLKACAGEYTCASFTLNSNKSAKIKISVSDLVNGVHSISKENIDITVIKVWNQAGYEKKNTHQVGRYATPELLLHDENLVHVEGDDWESVDEDNKYGKNYLKLQNGNYVDVSIAYPKTSAVYAPTIAERPIYDATTLQPVTLFENKNKQFWITAHVPSGTVAGDYTGVIKIQSDGVVIKTMNITATVLDLTLLSPNVEYSIYYRGKMRGTPSISSEYKSVEQVTAELQDMYKHGISNPNIYPVATDNELTQLLTIRQNIGFDNTNFYYMRANLTAANVEHFQTLCAPYGVENVYFYGPDESTIDTPEYRALITAIHEAGGYYFVAQSPELADPVADILDLAVGGSASTSTLADKYHSYGHKLFLYANPQSVPEYPATFRANYGLYLWQIGFDGAMDYAYQHSMQDIWNDFDDAYYRDHVFAYPTANGVVDTIQWEGFREGVNDMRYLATLYNTISQANAVGVDTTIVDEWLLSLKSTNLSTVDLYEVRDQIIDFIFGILHNMELARIYKIYQTADYKACLTADKKQIFVRE